MSAAQRKVIFAAWATATAAYLLWRLLATFEPRCPLWSSVFWALELLAALGAAAFYAVLVERKQRPLPEAQTGRSVDVFVCTYNEDLALVRQTLRRAMALDYGPGLRVWLLDDGDRPAARALAVELGCGYFARGENTHFKAGNLNHALARTSGELLLVLDADHLVRPHFLSRLAGYFEDPQVALVQTPQVYWNVDSFQHHLDAPGRRLWHEGAIFHHALQPCADRWNASFFVGTGAVVRRAALERVGGFAVESVTEDALTCLRMHQAGYRTVFHDEPLGFLLAPQSLVQYLTQRLRWGQGSMQILRLASPLTCPGLTWQQRLVYCASLSSFAQAVVHLAYYLAPPLFLLGVASPMRLVQTWQVGLLALHVAVDLATFKALLGPLARPLLSECYKLLNLQCFLSSLRGFFTRERLRFVVTAKGRDAAFPPQLLALPVALVLLNGTAFAVGMLRLAFAGSTHERLGLLASAAFAGFFSVVGGTALGFAVRRRAASGAYSFPDDEPATLGGAPLVVLRVGEHTVLAVAQPGVDVPAPGAEATLSLQWGARPLCVQARVEEVSPASAHRQPEGALLVRLSLAPLGDLERDRLHDHLVERAMPRFVSHLSSARAGEEPGEAPAWYLPLEPNVL